MLAFIKTDFRVVFARGLRLPIIQNILTRDAVLYELELVEQTWGRWDSLNTYVINTIVRYYQMYPREKNPMTKTCGTTL